MKRKKLKLVNDAIISYQLIQLSILYLKCFSSSWNPLPTPISARYDSSYSNMIKLCIICLCCLSKSPRLLVSHMSSGLSSIVRNWYRFWRTHLLSHILRHELLLSFKSRTMVFFNEFRVFCSFHLYLYRYLKNRLYFW